MGRGHDNLADQVKKKISELKGIAQNLCSTNDRESIMRAIVALSDAECLENAQKNRKDNKNKFGLDKTKISTGFHLVNQLPRCENFSKAKENFFKWLKMAKIKNNVVQQKLENFVNSLENKPENIPDNILNLLRENDGVQEMLNELGTKDYKGADLQDLGNLTKSLNELQQKIDNFDEPIKQQANTGLDKLFEQLSSSVKSGGKEIKKICDTFDIQKFIPK